MSNTPRKGIESCKHFNSCSANLCPLFPSIEDSVLPWYPDEEICKLHRAPEWVKRQRRIAKRTLPEDVNRFYTVQMLKHRCRIGKGVKGLKPEQAGTSRDTRRRAEAEWIAKRKPIPELSAEQAETQRERLRKALGRNENVKSA